MADISDIILSVLNGVDIDDSIVEYICSIVEGLSEEDRRTAKVLEEMIAPFLIESGVNDDDAQEICIICARKFGGSGFILKDSVFNHIDGCGIDEDGAPALLDAPVKMR